MKEFSKLRLYQRCIARSTMGLVIRSILFSRVANMLELTTLGFALLKECDEPK